MINGIANGFDIIDTDAKPEVAFQCNNKSAYQYRDQVEKAILKEIELGRYRIVQEPPHIVSPLGAVPKNDGEIRLIHDCSQPFDKAVNDYATINKHSFVSVDTAVSMVTTGSYMAKVDLQSAYRQVPLSRHSQNVAGLCWKFKGDTYDTFLVDTRLPFGASKSVGIFHRLTQSVCRILKRMGIDAIICFIDDFFITGASMNDVKRAMNILIHVLVSLGFAISWEKCISPTTRLTFLGVTIDTVAGSLSIPEEKINEVKQKIAYWNTRTNKASKRDFQSLIGSLSWIARIVHAARPCLRRFIDKMSTLKRSSHRARITADLRRDLNMLHWLCSSFNGTSFFLKRNAPEPAYIVSDASVPGAGAALILNNTVLDWFYINWKKDIPELLSAHINVKELTIIMLAVKRWSQLWYNTKIVIRTDNTAALFAVNKGVIRNQLASSILTQLRVICAIRCIDLAAFYINTKVNKLADSISRLDHLPTATYALARINMTRPLRHMSEKTWLFLFQSWQSKRRNWIWSG